MRNERRSKERVTVVLGDGQTINIHSDRWLRGKEDWNVDHSSTIVRYNVKVCEFFADDSKSWDELKVQRKFSQVDENFIHNTCIPQNGAKDMIAWIHSSNGQYTVKIGYQQ